MSRLSELALAKRSVTLLLAGALFIAGVGAWGSLKQELLPDIEFPVITVIVPLPGAGAADVAEQVTKPVERAISGVPRLEGMQSTSANSLALVVGQFEYGTDVKATLAQIEQNLQEAGLPQTVEPQVSALNINASPVVIASIVANSEEQFADAARIVQDEIAPELLAIEGVASVDVTGGEEQRVLVTLNPDELAANGISAAQVTGVLAANNLTFPSGQIRDDATNTPVSTIGTFGSIEEIENLVVGVATPPTVPTVPGVPAAPAPGASAAPGAPAAPAAPVMPQPVTIGDLGSVEIAGVATTGYAYTGTPETGMQPSLSVSVSKTSSANTVDVAAAVDAKLKELGDANADTVTVVVVSDLSSFIIESRDGLLKEGGLGALFAILTIFLFLASLRSTIVAAVSIPLSLLAALVLMQLTGITINIMTLGGLAVAIGRVVDDAIVVLENIYRHRALGDDRMTAALKGPREVAGAITSATVTTVLVFLPLGFVGGLVSQFFLPFALTVTFALLASLVCALTVVPVLAYLLIDKVKLNVDEDGEPRNSFWIRAYTPTIKLALRDRWTKWGVLLGSVVLFAATGFIAPLLPTQFINAGSENILGVTIAPPSGSSSDAVLIKTEEAEAILLADPKVELVQTSIPGEGEAGFQAVVATMSGRPANSARITVRLADDVDLTEYSRTLSEALAPVKTDGFDVAVAQMVGFSSNNLNVIVSGEDPAKVQEANDLVLEALSDNAELLNLKSDLSKATPEVQVRPDANKAIMVGLTAAQVAGEVRGALVGSTATSVKTPDQTGTVDVFVQLDPDQVTNVDQLRALPVGTVAKVPLGQIAEVEEVEAQGSITRIDEAPAASISAEIADQNTGKVSQDVQAELDALIAEEAWPEGVDVRLAGVTQQQTEAFGGLFVSMGVAILLVYVAMVLTFNSLVTPFVILFSLPLATIGAFPALLITGRPIGVSALIGFLMLIGIVVTNAIVLLDLVERLRAQGLSTKDALIEGGRTRVRPILMTAIATMLALIPLAAGLNEGSIIAAELGTVVIGGLLSSTFLTLLVVPVVYSLVDGARQWRRKAATVEAPVIEGT